MKKNAYSLFGILLLSFVLAFVHQVEAEEGARQGMGIVFVVDDSASMKESDPNKLAGESIRRFVDLLPAEGDKAAIVTYSYEPMEYQNLITISGDSSKQQLKQFSIDKIKQDGRNTDTAAGLVAGGNVLDKDNSSDQKAIILITDGENDLRNRERTEDQSEAALTEFLKKGYRVYTIGINPQTDSFKQYLTRIARESGGKVWFPTSSEELNGIIKEVAVELGSLSLENSDIVSVSNTEFTNIKQTVPKDVLEANIQIDHEEPIAVELLDTNGKSVFKDNKEVIIYSEEKYTNIKLLNPSSGDWTIRVKSSTKQIQVKVDWIFNYDVELSVEAPSVIKMGEKLDISASLSIKGTIFTKDQYDGIEAVATVVNKKSKESANYELLFEDNQFKVNLEGLKEGNYDLKVTVTGSNFTKSSQIITIDVGTIAEEESKEKEGISLWMVIAGIVIGIGGLVGIFLFIKSRQSREYLQGRLKISFFEGHTSNLDLEVELPTKTSVTLAQLLKHRDVPKYANYKHIRLQASGYKQIKFVIESRDVYINGLTNMVMDERSTAIVRGNENKEIRISFR